jgi:hypothetical protein
VLGIAIEVVVGPKKRWRQLLVQVLTGQWLVLCPR